ncbi:MAG: glycoside hydrolase family 88 protein [Luteolibacter sp.]
MRSRFFLMFLLATTPLSISGAKEVETATFSPDRIPDRQQVLDVITRAALTQATKDSGSVEWTWASYFAGALKLTEVKKLPELEQFAFRTAKRFQYSHRNDGAPVHLINADDQAIGDLYQWVYLRTGSPGVLLPLKQRLDYTVPYLEFQPEPEKLVWWWCDALFMAPPLLTKMSAITGDPKYVRAMDVQWWRVYDRLYDEEERLFARDARFIERRSPNGKKIFWARGQGWVISGLARVLEHMPADFPSRPRYVTLFQEMADRIVSLQQPDGLWRASLLDPEAFPDAETSGTAFFTYALAFGVNHSLLDREKYLPSALKGWAALNRYILPSGNLGQVQARGDQPVPTRLNSTGLYATGAFVLAGLEMTKLNDPVNSLPLPKPVVAELKYEAANWSGAKNPPADATEEQLEEFERGKAERQAVKDQSFDPVIHDPAYHSPVQFQD